MSHDPASVPMKDYVDMRVADLHLLMLTIDAKNAVFATMVDTKNSLAIDRALASEQLARTVALAEIKEKMAFHNDLIRKGERDNAEAKATYITWTSARAVLLTLVGIATLAIAYANLAPVFGVPGSVTVENPPSQPVPVDPAPEAK